MKRKINRMDLVGLSRNYYVLSREEMKSKMGGGDDGNPPGFGFSDAYGNYFWYRGYSQEDFINWTGPWYGGWVEGWGYVAPETFVYGSYTSYGSFGGFHWQYGIYENSGIQVSYSVYGDTKYHNGILFLGAYGYSTYDLKGVAIIRVNGTNVSYIPLDKSGANIYPTGYIPLGGLTIDLRNYLYQGNVEVYLGTINSYGNSYLGAGNVSAKDLVFSSSRR